MVCKNCGASNDNKAHFCEQCGAPLESDDSGTVASPEESKNGLKSLVPWIPSIVFVLVALILWSSSVITALLFLAVAVILSPVAGKQFRAYKKSSIRVILCIVCLIVACIALPDESTEEADDDKQAASESVTYAYNSSYVDNCRPDSNGSTEDYDVWHEGYQYITSSDLDMRLSQYVGEKVHFKTTWTFGSIDEENFCFTPSNSKVEVYYDNTWITGEYIMGLGYKLSGDNIAVFGTVMEYSDGSGYYIQADYIYPHSASS